MESAAPSGARAAPSAQGSRRITATPTEVAKRYAREAQDRLYDGISFAEEADIAGAAIWGRKDQVLWSRGEPFMLYGPQGVAKTTTAQRLTLGLAGIEPIILGLPVASVERPIFYAACDRPVQAARSWRRMLLLLRDDQREILRERVRFWKGPLPFDIAAEPDRLVEFVDRRDCGVFIGDSLKDLAVDLTKDEVGSRVNRAWQLLIAEGIELLDLHHPRKALAGQTDRPRSLDDVYGSAWLTAGHGSVVALWGRPGDPIVDLSHLKQPEEEVGPFRILIDHELGMIERHDGGDLLAMLRHAPGGLTARDAAVLLFNASKPTDSDVEKARRRLEKLVTADVAFPRPSDRDEHGRVRATTYFAAAPSGTQEAL